MFMFFAKWGQERYNNSVPPGKIGGGCMRKLGKLLIGLLIVASVTLAYAGTAQAHPRFFFGFRVAPPVVVAPYPYYPYPYYTYPYPGYYYDPYAGYYYPRQYRLHRRYYYPRHYQRYYDYDRYWYRD
jgi:hypothetical protein